MKRMALFCLIALPAFGCVKKEDIVSKHTNVTVIDGCQYLESAYALGTQQTLYSLTHKGNCNNPIHIYK
jgi:hypothetical protein